MSRLRRHAFSIAAGLLLVAALVYTGLTRPRPAVDPVAWLLFTALFLFTDTFSLPIGGGYMGLSAAAAVGGLLMMGPWAAAWMVLVGSLSLAVLSWAFPAQLRREREPGGWLAMAGIGLVNAVLLSLSLFAGTALYRAAGGSLPLVSLGPEFIGPFLLLVLGFAVTNDVLAAGYLRLPGDGGVLHTHLHALPIVVVYEVAPQIFSPLLPLIYNRLGPGPFLLFSVGLAAASLGARSLAVTGQRLEKRVSELKTLGALSQALAASLQMDDLLATRREQLPKIMPVDGLDVALYHPEGREVSFPLAVEKGHLLSWSKLPAVNGLTEYVLNTRQPLPIPDKVAAQVERLGLEPITRSAQSWLGVTIVAGSQMMDVLGVYALDPQARHLTQADRDLLINGATQLAAVLPNARLYDQTDKALAQRVQQLSSILHTTEEGILLLDAETRVLTANRALAGFVGLTASDLAGRTLSADDNLLSRLGTGRADLRTDLAELQNGSDLVRHTPAITGAAEREVGRTLAPVRGGSGEVAGWLMILRDVTEERALGQLRDDLTHMLVHDLRGPLGPILTSLALIQQMAPVGKRFDPDALEVRRLAKSSGEHLLHMINQLLDIARIESGAVPLERASVAPEVLLAAAAERLRPAAEAATIQLVAEAAPGLPELSLDMQLVGRVLDNPSDNAIKFSPNRATVRLWTRLEAAPGGVLFGVTDEGPGIPSEAQKHLFEKFNRVPNIHGRRAGTGLGLAFCRLVAEAHGGRIWVESAREKGSTIVARLRTSPME